MRKNERISGGARDRDGRVSIQQVCFFLGFFLHTYIDNFFTTTTRYITTEMKIMAGNQAHGLTYVFLKYPFKTNVYIRL